MSVSSDTPRSAFVTGATGAVGGALVCALLREGWRVHALHRARSDTGALRAAGAILVEGDIDVSEGIVGRIPAATDVVFHVAASLSLWSRHDRAQMTTNVGGTRNAITAALQAHARRFIHTSSVSAYGRPGAPLSEATASVADRSSICYERSKWLAECEVRKGIAQGLDAVIINPCAIMGPGYSAGWAKLLFQIKSGAMRALPPGSLVINHIYDVVDAHVAAATRGRCGENYILTGDTVAAATLIRAAGEIMGIPVRAPVLNARLLGIVTRIANAVSLLTGKEPDLSPEMAALLSQHLRCDTDKARRELGYRETPWKQCVEEMYLWLRERGRI